VHHTSYCVVGSIPAHVRPLLEGPPAALLYQHVVVYNRVGYSERNGLVDQDYIRMELFLD
jgi:hypothetical protein